MEAIRGFLKYFVDDTDSMVASLMNELDLTYELKYHESNVISELKTLVLLATEIRRAISQWVRNGTMKDWEHFFKMQDLYYLWKSHPCASRSHDNIDRRIIYYLAKLCYFHNASDCQMVSKIIHQVYQSFGSVQVIYSGTVLPGGSWKTLFEIAKWLPPPECPGDKLKGGPLTYFMKLGNQSQATFNGYRIIDYFVSVPSYLHVIDLDPKLLLLFLQYGSRFITSQEKGHEDTCAKVVVYFITLLRNRTGQHGGNGIEEEEKLAIIKIRILLRTIPQLKRTHTNELFHGLRPDTSEDLNECLTLLSDRYGVPVLLTRYSGVSELKHLCRCVIRWYLLRSWRLPDGIEELKLPKCICDYLNLLED